MSENRIEVISNDEVESVHGRPLANGLYPAIKNVDVNGHVIESEKALG